MAHHAVHKSAICGGATVAHSELRNHHRWLHSATTGGINEPGKLRRKNCEIKSDTDEQTLHGVCVSRTLIHALARPPPLTANSPQAQAAVTSQAVFSGLTSILETESSWVPLISGSCTADLARLADCLIPSIAITPSSFLPPRRPLLPSVAD